jgi:hypothetical protein
MRKIKFRAWKIAEARWNDWWIADIYVDENIEDEDLIIEQFTGLLDKNGKEVYEGDIVRQWDVNNCIDSLEYAFYRIAECTLDEDCEVIGNIHENPELLREPSKED